MSDVIETVYAQEHQQYEALQAAGRDGSLIAEWPEMLWEVLSQPSGMAVLEILQASRSDDELAALVRPTQERIELSSAQGMLTQIGWANEKETLAAVRLFVWAVRGLSIAQVLARDPDEIDQSIMFMKRMVMQAFGTVSIKKSGFDGEGAGGGATPGADV